MNILKKIMLMIAYVCALSPEANANVIPEKLLPLLVKKNEIALQFAKSANECVNRSDTKHAVFKGCIDWHSSVHGLWTLVAYTAMTGDKQFESTVTRLLDSAALADEQNLLIQNKAFEMPYGRAWLLRLALEYGRYYKDGRMEKIAEQAKSSLLEYYRLNPPDPRSRDYENASWAIINLYDYASFKHDTRSLDEVKSLIERYYLKDTKPCNVRNDRSGFMAVCTNRAWVISKGLSPDAFTKWSAENIPATQLPLPVKNPASAHENGLNFSRTWGLWELYSVTNRQEYIDSYVDHFLSTYNDYSQWRGDYRTVGHWVPQFGMFAIQPLFGPEFR